MILLTMTGSAVGFALAGHLAFGVQSKIARLLALFLFFLSIVLLEPLLPFLNTASRDVIVVIIGGSTFAIAPSLFLYCRYRLTDAKGTRYDLFHYLPAFIIMVSMAMSSLKGENLSEESFLDMLVYMFLLVQVFTYCVLATRIAFSRTKIFSKAYIERFHIVFVRLLVVFTLSMFTYSFLNTLLSHNSSKWFVNSIQLLLNLAIIIIALFNAEGLEKHRRYHTKSRFESD